MADAIDADADAYVNRRVLLCPPRSVGHIIASLWPYYQRTPVVPMLKLMLMLMIM